MKMKKCSLQKEGFTLAEVLITLGIIGVVAAMTIPTLITNTNSQKFRAQYKKSLSTLNQAALMNLAQNDWNFSDIKTSCKTSSTDTSDPSTTQSFCAMMNGTLAGAQYVKLSTSYQAKLPTIDGAAGGITIGYKLADGSLVIPSRYMIDGSGSLQDNPGNHGSATGFIDANGEALPNKEVKCADGTVHYTVSAIATPATSGGTATATCTVDNKSIGDIFPVYFHEGTVEPASDAARSVLYSTK